TRRCVLPTLDTLPAFAFSGFLPFHHFLATPLMIRIVWRLLGGARRRQLYPGDGFGRRIRRQGSPALVIILKESRSVLTKGNGREEHRLPGDVARANPDPEYYPGR